MVYQKIKKIADSKGISIYRIEKDCGLANGTIGKWGNTAKQMPTAISLKKVSDYLKVPMEELIKQKQEA